MPLIGLLIAIRFKINSGLPIWVTPHSAPTFKTKSQICWFFNSFPNLRLAEKVNKAATMRCAPLPCTSAFSPPIRPSKGRPNLTKERCPKKHATGKGTQEKQSYWRVPSLFHLDRLVPSWPYSAFGALSQKCPFFGSTRKGHISKNLESLIFYLLRQFAAVNMDFKKQSAVRKSTLITRR